ncbi:lactadherin-like [Porites lutea]
MTASTRYSGHPAYHGRLHYPNSAWCAKDSAEDEDWLQIDLGTTYEICGAATQGTGNQKYNEYVTKFKLSYSSDGSSWTMYTGTGGSETEFHRNGGKNTVDEHLLPSPLSTRYIRFYPTDQVSWNCLRVELYSTALLK